MRLVSPILLGLVLTVSAFAAPIPEIDANSSVTAISLLGGAVLVVRSWRRK
jgi:hypothetical protein